MLALIWLPYTSQNKVIYYQTQSTNPLNTRQWHIYAFSKSVVWSKFKQGYWALNIIAITILDIWQPAHIPWQWNVPHVRWRSNYSNCLYWYHLFRVPVNNSWLTIQDNSGGLPFFHTLYQFFCRLWYFNFTNITNTC